MCGTSVSCDVMYSGLPVTVYECRVMGMLLQCSVWNSVCISPGKGEGFCGAVVDPVFTYI